MRLRIAAFWRGWVMPAQAGIHTVGIETDIC
jgi:hypothetical protein